MASKINYTKEQLIELLDSIPELANDLITVINTYATKEELATEVKGILNNVSAVKKSNLLLVNVEEIPDITPY